MKRALAGAFALAMLAGMCACPNVARSTALSNSASASASGRIEEARTSHWSVIPVNATQPLWELVVGRDHAVWATSTQPPGLYRVGGSGQPVFYPLNNFEPQTFGLGSGAHFWIVSSEPLRMLSYDTKTQTYMQFNAYSPTQDSPASQVFIPEDDGSVWYDEFTHVANMSRNGTITEFAYPTQTFGGGHMTKTPDGRIWFDEYELDPPRIGWIRPRTHALKDFPLPSDIRPQSMLSMTTAADGSVWVAASLINTIFVHIDPKTMHMTESPGFETSAYDVVAAPNGLLYFGPGYPNVLGAYDPAKNTVTYDYTPNADGTSRVIVGPDENIWAVMGPTPAIGVFSLH